MSQSSYIAGVLILGFVVYITMRGQIPAYKAVLFGSPAPASSGAGASTSW